MNTVNTDIVNIDISIQDLEYEKLKNKRKKSNKKELEKLSFFDIDNNIFKDKSRWINFVSFSKNLQSEMQDHYQAEMQRFWIDYGIDNVKPLISWVEKKKLQICKEKINNDKERSHTQSFKDIKINKTILQIEDLSIFKNLELEFPNFKEVIDMYKGFFVLNSSRKIEKFQAPRPVLLLGKPGIGKTRFAKRLAQVLKTDYKFLDSNSITQGGVLTGQNASWKGADAGFIFKTLAPCENLSPIILLDEFDKLSITKEHTPFSTFHQLLEPENSASLYDEFLELEFNASFIIYILTANDDKNIPESLLSRLNVIEINNPDVEQMKVISQNIFTELLAGSKLFKKVLPTEVINYLSKFSPREVYQILSKNLFKLSCSQAKKQNNIFTIESSAKKEHKMGF